MKWSLKTIYQHADKIPVSEWAQHATPLDKWPLDPTSAHCGNVWIVGGKKNCGEESFEASLHLWWPLWWAQQRCGNPPPADESRWTGPWQNPLWTHGSPRLASCRYADQTRGQSPGEENSSLGQSGLIYQEMRRVWMGESAVRIW